MRSRQANMQPGTLVHDALFYQTEDEFVAVLSDFIEDGLSAGDPVLAALPPGSLAAIKRNFKSDSPDLRLVDMSVAGRNPGRILPWVLHAFSREAGTRRARIIGEPIWAERTPAEYPACVQHESLINLALAARNVTVLCPYDVRRLPRQQIIDAETTHPFVIDDRGRQHSARYRPARHAHAVFEHPLDAPPAHAAGMRFGRDGLREVRAFVLGVGRAAGMQDHDVSMLQMAVNEAATNAVEHGGGSGDLLLWSDQDHLVCEVRSSRPFTNLLAGRMMVDHSSIRGRGLLLINQVCDLVRTHVDHSGTTVRMWMVRQRSTRERPDHHASVAAA